MSLERTQNKLLQNIALIISQNLQDPKIGFVTVVGLKTSKDLDLATVYINILGQNAKKEASLKRLNGSAGFIRTKLAKKLKIRKIPKLRFKIDDKLEKANRIEELIKKVK